MASPNLDVPFHRGRSYCQLHQLAKGEHAEPVEREHFMVAILQHDKDLTCNNPFKWFRVKHDTTVRKVAKGYNKHRDVTNVVLKHPFPVHDGTPMSSLNLLGDNCIVLIAQLPATSTSSDSASQTRAPLKPMNSQAHNIASILKPEFKPEGPPYHGGLNQIPPPMLTQVKDENRVMKSPVTPSRIANLPTYRHDFGRYANENNRFGSPLPTPDIVKEEDKADILQYGDVEPAVGSSDVALEPRTNRLQKLIETSSPERLEAEVKVYKDFLDSIREPLFANSFQGKDAQYFLQQIDALRNQQVDSPTIIGVVGNTGAGKSSVINAMLEEERLVPTNCMRACTAVVTEMSWNPSEDPNSKYKANIEFIKASDWEKDLRVSLTELMDGNGQVSRDCSNTESEAGIAYAKIKAVYPNKTKDDLANTTVEKLMNEPEVKAVLDTIKNIERARPEPFYKALQHFVDSKEKSIDSKKKKEKGENRQMEFWPLIKVVRIFTKADALSTGAVIVDLPGVHDSNAARAAVAASYMKQCTGLWIVAPINRAVDDKAAKSLLGESFKRQLKYDGTYSRITFICSKSDDISVTEASDSLGLEEQMRDDWAEIDEIDAKKRILYTSLKDIKESRAVYFAVITESDDMLETWEELKASCEDGNEIFAPGDKSTKRKRSSSSAKSRLKSKKAKKASSNLNDDFIDNKEEEVSSSESDGESSEGETEPDEEQPDRQPLSMEDIEAKIGQLKEDKKRARRERLELDAKNKATNEEIVTLQAMRDVIETKMSAVCIEGRNKYSKGAIQQDFAAGIRELDQENAQEEDEDNFDPTAEMRDYEEVARSLPVFCCSSRAYQKMSGRLQRDSKVPGFRSIKETEIPQLQQHCKKLTEGVRASNCRRFLTNLSQTLTSLKMWASNDGTGLKMSHTQRGLETRFLKARLQTLDMALGKAVEECLTEMNEALAENIFEHFPDMVAEAASKASSTSESWGSPVNRGNRQLGGFYWATYKALCRRNGVFSGANGPVDMNSQLCEPIIKLLASNWEKAFSRRLPSVLQSYSRKSKNLLIAFHEEVETRSMKHGAGVAGLAMLGQQLRNYEAMFANLVAQMSEIITSHQRETNREFTPVIANRLLSAYEWCAAAVGAGQYKRMKEHMNDHVSGNLDMFDESCSEVKKRLGAMCRLVEEAMASKADEVFIGMQRDYMEVISGNKVGDQMMPKWERQLRADVGKIIEDSEMAAEEAEMAEQQPKPETATDATSATEADVATVSTEVKGEDKVESVATASDADRTELETPIAENTAST